MRKYTSLFFNAIYDTLRLQLGFWEARICIYEESCGDYAKRIIQEQLFLLAILRITLRVLSCNPIGALVKKINRFLRK